MAIIRELTAWLPFAICLAVLLTTALIGTARAMASERPGRRGPARSRAHPLVGEVAYQRADQQKALRTTCRDEEPHPDALLVWLRPPEEKGMSRLMVLGSEGKLVINAG